MEMKNHYNMQQKISWMSATAMQAARYRHDWVKLPKLSLPKGFRIRSASKDRLNNNGTTASMGVKKDPQTHASADKYRSNSLKSTMSRKTITKKSEAGNSSEDDNSQIGSCRLNSKVFLKEQQKTIERDYVQNMEKLQRIAKLFDPKTIMKMGRKKSECSHEESRKENKASRNLKGQFRMNQYIFQGKSRKKEGKNDQAEQFWRQVNESLILPQRKPHEDQVSKDLREIYETFVTE